MTLQEAHEARAAYQSAAPGTRKACPELKEKFLQAIGFIEGHQIGQMEMRERAANESEIDTGYYARDIGAAIRALPLEPK